MLKQRLDALSDGIFAIVMTLLVIEIRVPELHGTVTDATLWHTLVVSYPLFLSYILSFALLFTYWRAHSYLMSYFAKNVDTTLSNYNAIFFLFVALVPFSSYLLGRYSETQIGTIVIGLNTIAIGVSLLLMRNYIQKSSTIDNVVFTPKNWRHGTIRTMVPMICAVLAIIFSFANITVSLLLFTVAVLFNFLPRTADLIDLIFFKNSTVSDTTTNRTKQSTAKKKTKSVVS